jgi:hypothetical protein
MSEEAKNDETKPAAEPCGCQAQAEKQESSCGCQGQTCDSDPSLAALPPADFSFMASSLYVQGMMSLGLMPGSLGADAAPDVKLDRAQHTIDTLDMLKEKTSGNLTTEEEQLIEGVLHQLRMAFVKVKEEPAKS